MEKQLKAKVSETLMDNKIFVWLGVAVALLLTIPLIAMQFSADVVWTPMDFGAMAALLLGAGSIFIAAARRFPKHLVAIAIIVALGFLYLWAELAVGIFTNWGS